MEKIVEKVKIIEYEKKIVFLEKKVSDLEMIKVGRNDIKCYICNGLPCGQKGPRYTRSRRKGTKLWPKFQYPHQIIVIMNRLTHPSTTLKNLNPEKWKSREM